MKTKVQKTEDVKKASELFDKSNSIVFVNFSKTPTKEIDVLKNSLASASSSYKVVKKRLLGLVFKNKKAPIDINLFDSQLGTVFSSKDIVDSAGMVYRFLKGKEKELPEFKMLGGYDTALLKYYSAEEINKIGKLPSKEILLSQLLGMLSAPTRSLAYVLDQIAKKQSVTK